APLATPAGGRYLVRRRRLEAAAAAPVLVTLAAQVTTCRSELSEVLPRHCRLSRQQTRVVALLCRGLGNKEIAAELGVCAGTVKNYLTDVYLALDVHSRTELVALIQELSAARAAPVRR
ncbi:MAG TPA: LuxR C-terminal-related transcriptional regulator, partial [Kofleriaceae bacterium]|nr:LuxR C-terminal-related transcriptional regulator [Kofleriaceae bacterium]